MPIGQTNGLRIYYEVVGEGAPILLIHGAGTNASFWGSDSADLAALGYRVVSYDRRGCSRTERPQPYIATSGEEQADDAAALLDVLGFGAAIVIGRSFGGLVALKLAERHPEKVRSLVLLEPAPSGISAEADAAMERLTAHIRQTAATDGVAAVGQALITAVLGVEGWEALPEQAQGAITGNGEALLAEFNMPQPEITDPASLGAIRQSTLIVLAQSSPDLFRHVGEALAAFLSRAQIVLVSGGHYIRATQPEVLEFIAGLAPARA